MDILNICRYIQYDISINISCVMSLMVILMVQMTRTNVQNIGAVVDTAVELFADLMDGDQDDGLDHLMMARNFLRYGLTGYCIVPGNSCLDFTDHENLRHDPGRLRRDELKVLVSCTVQSLRQNGQAAYAEVIESQYGDGMFEVFDPCHR